MQRKRGRAQQGSCVRSAKHREPFHRFLPASSTKILVLLQAAHRSVWSIEAAKVSPSIAWAASDGIPKLDVRPVCRGIASQSADPGVGQRNQTETFQQCIESEQAVLEQLKQGWSGFSAEDRRHCVALATTGGESSNTALLTCLEMARDVRALRSAASGAETTKPAPSLSKPTA